MALKDCPPRGIHPSIRRWDRRKLIVKPVRETQAAQTTGAPRPPWSGPAGSRPPGPPSACPSGLDVLFHYRAHVAVLEYALRISLGHYTRAYSDPKNSWDQENTGLILDMNAYSSRNPYIAIPRLFPSSDDEASFGDTMALMRKTISLVPEELWRTGTETNSRL